MNYALPIKVRNDLLGLAAGLVVWRLLFFIGLLVQPLPPAVDQDIYFELAQQLSHGIFGDLRLLLVSPLYPYLWSGFSNAHIVFAVQMATGVGLGLLTYLIAWRIYKARSTAWIAALLLQGYGPALLLEAKVYPTTLSIFFTMLFVAAWHFRSKKPRRASLIMMGLPIALAIFLVPTALIFIILWIILNRRELTQRHLWMALPFALIALLLGLRNYQIDQVASPFGINLGVTYAQGNFEATHGSFHDIAGFDATKQHQHLHAKRLAEKESQKDLSWQEVDRFWFHKSVRWLATHPLSALKLHFHKLRRFLSDDFLSADINFAYERSLNHCLRWLPISFSLLLLLSVLALPGWHRDFVALFAAVLAANLLFYVAERYRLPAVYALVFPAAYSLQALRAASSRKKMVVALATLALVIFQIGFSPPSAATQQGRWNQAHGLEVRGELQQALILYKELQATKPSATNLHAIFRVERLLQNPLAAKIALADGLQTFADSPLLHNDAGVLALDSKQPNRAIPHFLKAWEGAPFVTVSMMNLAKGYWQLDEKERAIDWLKIHLDYFPHDWRAHHLLSRYYFELADLSALGIAATEQALYWAGSYADRQGESWLQWGLYQERRGNRQAAKAAYLRSYELLPNSFYPALNLAIVSQIVSQNETAANPPASFWFSEAKKRGWSGKSP